MEFYGRLIGNGTKHNSLIFKLGLVYKIVYNDGSESDTSENLEALAKAVGIAEGPRGTYSYSTKNLQNKIFTIAVNLDIDGADDEDEEAVDPKKSDALGKIYNSLLAVNETSVSLVKKSLTKSNAYVYYDITLDTYITDYTYQDKLESLTGKLNNLITSELATQGINYTEDNRPSLINNVLSGNNFLYSISYNLNKLSTTTTTTTKVPEVETPEVETPNVVDSNNADTVLDSESQDTGRSEASGEENISTDVTEQKIPGINNVFPNTYYPEKIEMNIDAPTQSKGEVAQGVGAKPFLWYNVYQISYVDINYFLLSHNGISPTIKVTFYDSLGVMADNAIPVDDSKIKVYIDPGANNLKPIFLEFKISNFSTSDGLYVISGVLDLNPLYLPSFKAYKEKTSFYALQDVMKELGLGFNSNLADTDDQMTWVNPGDRVFDFIDSIVNNSYKSDYSFMLGYIDFYYNFNYVDIEDELSRDIQEEQGITSYGLEQAANTGNLDDKVGGLALSNDPSMDGTNMFIDSYKIINNSTNISLTEGYLTKTKYYNESDKELLVFDVDSISSEGGKIVMKSSDQDFYEKNINLVYNGKIDIDNAHKNFNYSAIQNDRNVTELTKLGLDAVLTIPNFNLYRFQKVKVIISSQTPTPSHTLVNERLSGDWFIADIKFEMVESNFYQKILMVKRELEALAGEEYRSENSVYHEGNDGGGENPYDLSNTDVSNFGNSAKSPINNNTKYSEKIKPIIAAFSYWKITNKYYKRAILANIKKECNLVPKYENLSGWANTSNSRIREFFGQRVRGYNEAQLTSLKKNTPQFAEVIYGVKSNMGLGNDRPGDGWKYRGAGYIQLTGKANMRKYGKYANIDLVSDPSILISDPYKSAIVSVGFLVKQIKNGNFSSQSSANRAVTQVIGGSGLNLNAGAGAELLANVNNYSNEFNNVV